MKPLVVSVGIVATLLVLWRFLPAQRQPVANELGLSRLETVSGLKMRTSVTVVRSYREPGDGSWDWFEFKVPPERVPELIESIVRLGNNRTKEGVKQYTEVKADRPPIIGIDPPKWFQPTSLKRVRSFSASYAGSSFWIAISEEDGRIILCFMA